MGYYVDGMFVPSEHSGYVFDGNGNFVANAKDYEIVMNLVNLYDKKDKIAQKMHDALSYTEIMDVVNQLNEVDKEIFLAIYDGSKNKLSKLSLEYRMADPKKYLIFKDPSKRGIDFIFAARLAALAKDHNTKIYIGPQSGLRSYQDTVDLWLKHGGLYDSKTGKYIKGPNFDNIPAYPGLSWHVNGEAVDAGSSKWLCDMCNGKTISQTELLAYGLFKPLAPGNGYPTKTQKAETWHIQPIETNKRLGVDGRRSFYKAYAE